MHAKPDLRLFLKWMIYRSGSVIAAVITPKDLKCQILSRECSQAVRSPWFSISHYTNWAYEVVGPTSLPSRLLLRLRKHFSDLRKTQTVDIRADRFAHNTLGKTDGAFHAYRPSASICECWVADLHALANVIRVVQCLFVAKDNALTLRG